MTPKPELTVSEKVGAAGDAGFDPRPQRDTQNVWAGGSIPGFADGGLIPGFADGGDEDQKRAQIKAQQAKNSNVKVVHDVFPGGGHGPDYLLVNKTKKAVQAESRRQGQLQSQLHKLDEQDAARAAAERGSGDAPTSRAAESRAREERERGGERTAKDAALESQLGMYQPATVDDPRRPSRRRRSRRRRGRRSRRRLVDGRFRSRLQCRFGRSG